MSKVLVNETSLNGIAAAIREKNGETTKYKPSEMAAAITALVIGGGGSGGGDTEGVPEVLNYSTLAYAFANNNYNWVLENFGDRIKVANVNSCEYMFCDSNNYFGYIPFKVESAGNEVNFKKAFAGTYAKIPEDFFEVFDYKIGDASYMFSGYGGSVIPGFKQYKGNYKEAMYLFNGCSAEEIGDLELSPASVAQMFSACHNLIHCPNIKFNTTRHQNYAYGSNNQVFMDCTSMRTIPETVLKEIYGIQTSASYLHLNSTFNRCYCLDEVVGLSPKTGTLTSNCFNNTFYKCYRLKRIVFDTDNGTPYKVNWSNQTISIYDGVGWSNDVDYVINDTNGGITKDKKVVDAATYQALKDDPDWYTGDFYYSRFNHDSAVEFINSLPDASGGTGNTVKMREQAGWLTDGGKIGDLTEEEIAVATAKGWTITYNT